MMVAHTVIREAYRAVLADWVPTERIDRDMVSTLIDQTIALASVWANEDISAASVVSVIKATA